MIREVVLFVCFDKTMFLDLIFVNIFLIFMTIIYGELIRKFMSFFLFCRERDFAIFFWDIVGDLSVRAFLFIFTIVGLSG